MKIVWLAFFFAGDTEIFQVILKKNLEKQINFLSYWKLEKWLYGKMLSIWKITNHRDFKHFSVLLETYGKKNFHIWKL